MIAVRRDALQARKTLKSARQSNGDAGTRTASGNPPPTRGDFFGLPNVESAVPNQLHPLSELERPLTRLDLAHWLADSDNPLTPRVAVNRMWQKLFGVGLVETVEDLAPGIRSFIETVGLARSGICRAWMVPRRCSG